MINLMPYNNIQNDLSYRVERMNLIINFTHFNSDFINVSRDSGEIVIPFETHNKYNKNIAISITRSGKLVIDEPFEDPFYYESEVEGALDKICWFNIPANYTGQLDDLVIYAKGGVQDELQ